jgi:acetate kinase
MAESRIILALNSGSTSIKFAAYNVTSDAEQVIIEGEIDGIGQGQGQTVLKDRDGKELQKRTHAIPSQESAMSEAATMLREHLPADPAAVGHRIVHGGPDLRDHLIITPKVLAQLEAATHFAPLHIPSALRIVRKAEQLYQSATQIACFDTTFHQTMPEVATHLPLPTRYYEAGVRRYGFHGLSCESVLHRVSSPKPGKIIIAHLGGGSSVTAVRDGRSIDTSMGMTPTGGVPMSLRTGDLDPSVLIYLMRTENMSADALETMVNHQCGLVGLSNGEGDMQALLARSDDAARLAVDIFTTEIRKRIGGYIALMGGIDLMIFTGGIGQHSAVIRERILDGLESMGLSVATGKVRSLPAEEEIQIARHCRTLLGE